MIRLRSISLRLTVWFSAVFLLGLVLFGTVMWLELAYSLRAGREKTLNKRADRLGDLLKAGRMHSRREREQDFLEFAQATPEGSLIQVFDAQQHRVYPGPDSPANEFPWHFSEHLTAQQYTEEQYQGISFLVLQRLFVEGTRPLLVCVAGQLSDNRFLLGGFSAGLVAVIPMLLVLSALGGYFLSRRALKPVHSLIVSARKINIQNLSGALPVTESGDELQHLSETWNEMLARLEAAVNQLKRFTADASHELRSPLSFIRTVAECASLNAEADAESRRAFQEIIQESEEASRLLDDMLALARADTGDKPALSEEVNLIEVLQETCAKIRPLADVRRQALSISVSSQTPLEVVGDHSGLRRLFWILLDNAVKYTEIGGRIDVTLLSNESTVKVLISDNGIGIPPAALPFIFDRFYRVDPSRGDTSGTGLGLAIAKWIAEIHQASLSVKSQERRGSTFEVLFPSAATQAR